MSQRFEGWMFLFNLVYRETVTLLDLVDQAIPNLAVTEGCIDIMIALTTAATTRTLSSPYCVGAEF
jgi:hypothetical protein